MRNELHYVTRILVRDLEALARELEAYPDEASLWKTPTGITNSGGNLALHLVGNLQHFIGTVLGRTSYVRDRDAEFRSRNVPRGHILEHIRTAVEVVEQVVPAIEPDLLSADYPTPLVNCRITTEDFLLHLVAHFCYHLGQIDYHRRVVTGQATGVGAVNAAKLYSARPIE